MLILGKNVYYDDPDSPNAEVETVYLGSDARKQGTYIVGTTGTGKTTLLLNLVCQDMERGEGLCVLDPHGDFTSDIIERVPKNRLADVVLLDPADGEYPFGLNLFDCNKNDPRERDLVVSTLIDTLYKLFEHSWGPRMEDLLRHSILTLLYHPEPTTLIDLMLLMVSTKHRTRLSVAGKQKDPILRAFWEEQFDVYSTRERVEVIGSSLNKIGRFIANPIIRHIVGQPKSTFNLRQIMDEGKILLVNLSKGDIGGDNANFLGAILVNQLLIAALSRRDIPEGQRRPFHLYVDEYQNFATKTFPDLQSEARKYGIDTVVAHQYRDQLDEQNLGSSLNVANLIVLRVSGRDAVEMAPQFDLTPPPPQVKFEPIRYAVNAEGTLFATQKTERSGQTLEQLVEGIQKPYSDMHLEMANWLAQQENYHAICRVLGHQSSPVRLYQFFVYLESKPVVNPSQGQAAVAFVRQQARQLTTFTREEIARYIVQQTQAEGDNSGLIPEFDTQ